MKIAVITPLPPETTGVAEFSERIYGSNKEFDVFWSTGGKAFDIGGFFSKALECKYDAIIFTLANSSHNFPTVDLLRRFAGFPGVHRKIFIHIHDPVLMNLARHVCEKEGKNVLRLYEKDRGLKEGSIGDIYQAFENFGFTGLSYLLANINVNTVIVHSNAALELVKYDLGERVNKIPHFLKLFHPCFDPMTNIPMKKREYDLGIFGVADDGGKMTSKAVEVILKAYDRGLIKKAVLCGYNARSYAVEKDLTRFPFFEFIENPSHSDMFKVMSNTRVAIQPRLLNTGESSGVVPMLVGAHVHSIVSKVGAFKEYPDSLVKKVENRAFVSKSIEILPSLLNETVAGKSFEDYWRSHSSQKFIEGLLSHVQKVSSRQDFLLAG